MLKLDQHNDLATLVARLFFASLFVTYGYFKITVAGTTAYMAKQGFRCRRWPPRFRLLSSSAVVCSFCSAIRPASWPLICAVYVLLAALIAHRNFADGNPDVPLLQKHGDHRRLPGVNGQRRRALFAGRAQVLAANETTTIAPVGPGDGFHTFLKPVNYRVQTMATTSQLLSLQPEPPAGIAPVMSSWSTLR